MHGTAVSKMQQLWRINMVTPKYVETTSASHVYFAKYSTGEMKTKPLIAQNVTMTRSQNCCNELWHLYRSTHNRMKVSVMPLKTVIAHACWVAVSVWLSFGSSPSMCVSSFQPTGHPVNSAMILIQSLQTQSPQILPSPPGQTFPVVNQGHTPPLHCPGSTSMTLYIYPRTRDLNWYPIFMIRCTCPWHLTISLSDNTENCMLPAMLESKRMNVTMYFP